MAAGLVRPQYNWGSASAVDGGTLAYLTIRSASAGNAMEIGVCAYGPDAAGLARRLFDRIIAWDLEMNGTGDQLWIEVHPPTPSLRSIQPRWCGCTAVTARSSSDAAAPTSTPAKPWPATPQKGRTQPSIAEVSAPAETTVLRVGCRQCGYLSPTEPRMSRMASTSVRPALVSWYLLMRPAWTRSTRPSLMRYLRHRFICVSPSCPGTLRASAWTSSLFRSGPSASRQPRIQASPLSLNSRLSSPTERTSTLHQPVSCPRDPTVAQGCNVGVLRVALIYGGRLTLRLSRRLGPRHSLL